MASDAFIALLALLSSFFSLFFRSPPRPLPPGPKPWPLLGNVTDLRPKELWLLATDWSKRYGPSSLSLRLNPVRIVTGGVVYLHLFGRGLIFLNSPAAVIELMERRSAIYSDRAPLVMVTELFVPCVDY
jgi:hypothetical protein